MQRRMAEHLGEKGLRISRVPCIPAVERRIYKPDGTVAAMPEVAAAYTAWDVLLGELDATVNEANILRGRSVVALPGGEHDAVVQLEDGSTLEADVLVAADGIGSLARRSLLPGTEPEYAGYVAWRGMSDEVDVDPELTEQFGDSLSTFTSEHTSIVLYEVPGTDASVRSGARRLNWVWYENVAAGDELEFILTDKHGVRHRGGVGRDLFRDELHQRIADRAQAWLPPAFARVVLAAREPFVQSIEDLLSPQLVFGRTVLIGDAASLIRPHIGSGTAKAVDDAIELAAALGDGSDPRLEAWQIKRLDQHYALSQYSRAMAARLGLGSGRVGAGVSRSSAET